MREYPESKYSSGSLVAGQAAYSIVHCLYAKGDIDQAMAALDKALDLCPDARSGDNDGALRSEIFLNMMESEEEKRAAGQVMADGRPSDPGKYLYLRACCMKWDEALRAYQKFISLYPKHPFAGAALASTARSLSALGLCDEAIARYRRILDEYPDAQYLTGKGVAPRAAWSLACCYYVKGDMKSAKAAFDFALEKYPDTNVRRKLYGEVFLTLVKKLETAADEPQKVPPK
jgi:tetratricopeptide (TPR) repeat protein